VGFLDRFRGRGDEQNALRWFDLEPAGYFEIAGVAHHKDALRAIFGTREVHRNVVSESPIGDTGLTLTISTGTTGQEILEVPAELRRDPRNRYDANAVEVRISDLLVGYIPTDAAPAWSRFLSTCEAEGYRVRAMARVWVGDDRYYVNLHAHRTAKHLPPLEAQAELRELAERAAKADVEWARVSAERDREKADRLFEKIAAKDARAANLARESAWRAAGRCERCGGALEPHVGRGRPSIYCGACRPAR
jgi:hypothetical protein